jgi:hypothetical protein
LHAHRAQGRRRPQDRLPEPPRHRDAGGRQQGDAGGPRRCSTGTRR